MTFFRNTDNQPHHPVFTDPNINVAEIPAASGGKVPVSTPVEPGRALQDGGFVLDDGMVTMTYTCSLHPTESGQINIVPDFFMPAGANQVSVVQNQQLTPLALTTGGAAPYTLQPTTLPAGFTLANTAAGLVLSGASATLGVSSFPLDVTDSFGNTINATIFITVTAPAAT
ncbi:MAG: hypothetical protein HY820_10255 [Acidobacteria bacterium]|nr:hypothetical protein [Acidobacteriota bacterium]